MLLKRAGESKKSKSKTHRKLHPHEAGGSKAAGGVFPGGGKEGGGAEGAPKKSSMQMAREALFALLRAAQVLAPGLGLGWIRIRVRVRIRGRGRGRGRASG